MLSLCLQKSIFEGIAQEALSECVKSLCSASAAIKNTKVSDCEACVTSYIHLLQPHLRIIIHTTGAI